MKRPVLEVIRFDEADIIITSGLRFTADNFGNKILKDGTFSFFGGSGSVTSVTTGNTNEDIVSAFNSYFGGGWGSTVDISVNGSGWESRLQEMIGRDRGDDMEDHAEYQKIQRHVLLQGSRIPFQLTPTGRRISTGRPATGNKKAPGFHPRLFYCVA